MPPGTLCSWCPTTCLVPTWAGIQFLFVLGRQLSSQGLCGLSVGESGPRAGLGLALPAWSAAVPVCHGRLVTSHLLGAL